MIVLDIEKKMAKFHVTYDKLAARTGLDKDMLINFSNGCEREIIYPEDIDALCRYFRCKPGKIIKWIEMPKYSTIENRDPFIEIDMDKSVENFKQRLFKYDLEEVLEEIDLENLFKYILLCVGNAVNNVAEKEEVAIMVSTIIGLDHIYEHCINAISYNDKFLYFHKEFFNSREPGADKFDFCLDNPKENRSLYTNFYSGCYNYRLIGGTINETNIKMVAYHALLSIE